VAAHSYIAIRGPVRLQPSGVREYSTRTGTSTNARRTTQRLRERLLRDLAHLVQELAVPAGAGGERVEHVHAPPRGEEPDDFAGRLDHLVVRDVRELG
jgi:hypothetical protein